MRTEAQAALEQSGRLTATIEELLALARTGRAGTVTQFDVAELVEHHADDAVVLFEHEGRDLVVDAPTPAPVRATVGAVGQIIEVLLANALRHGAGTVTIRVSRDDRHAFIDVGDEGAGIADQEIATLFDESASASGHDPRHGIGLPLARTLVTAEGGTITLLEARPPQFRVALPLAGRTRPARRFDATLTVQRSNASRPRSVPSCDEPLVRRSARCRTPRFPATMRIESSTPGGSR